MKKPVTRRDTFIATSLAVIILLTLCVVAFVIARPFLAPLLWGVILAIATWPIFTWCRRRLGGRNGLAATLVTLALAVVVLGPVVLLAIALSDNVVTLGDKLRAALQGGLPPPEFVAKIPLVGARISQRWTELLANGTLSDEARVWLGSLLQWLLGAAGAIGGGVAELALSVVCAFFFYRDGEAALQRARDVLDHVAGPRAHHLMMVAYGTLKGVVYGVLGSALVQALLAMFGYWLAGVPAPILLGLATGFLGIIPGGTALVWLPAAVWLFHSGDTAWGIFVILWGGLLVGSVDNFIRPLFISRGSPLPLLLVLIGILGGATALGFIGIFLGPTILAILYALMREWSPGDIIGRGPNDSADEPPPPAVAA
ncbi:MAG: AI-2E family transporter [Reyranellaceae bacterium]